MKYLQKITTAEAFRKKKKSTNKKKRVVKKSQRHTLDTGINKML